MFTLLPDQSFFIIIINLFLLCNVQTSKGNYSYLAESPDSENSSIVMHQKEAPVSDKTDYKSLLT